MIGALRRAAAAPAPDLRAMAEAEAAGAPALILAAEALIALRAPGAHGRRQGGAGGEEFWQYRPAQPGEPARAIDWRRSARSDALSVRERERQAPQTLALWVSGADGMRWRGDAARPTKRDRAVVLALALGLMALRGGERVVAFAAPDAAPVPGLRRGEALARDLLTGAPAARLPAPETLHRGQRLVIFDDGLGDPAELAAVVAGQPGGALMLVSDPDEETFPLTGALSLTDAAGAELIRTAAAEALRPAYLTRRAERRAALAAICAAARWSCLAHRTDAPPAEALAALSHALGG